MSLCFWIFGIIKKKKKNKKFTILNKTDYSFTLNPNYNFFINSTVENTTVEDEIKNLVDENKININANVIYNENIQNKPLGIYYTRTIVYISVKDNTWAKKLKDTYSEYILSDGNKSFESISIVNNFSGNFEERVERLFDNFNVGYVKTGIDLPFNGEYEYTKDDFVIFLKNDLSNSKYSTNNENDKIYLQPFFKQKNEGNFLWIKTKNLDNVITNWGA